MIKFIKNFLLNLSIFIISFIFFHKISHKKFFENWGAIIKRNFFLYFWKIPYLHIPKKKGKIKNFVGGAIIVCN